MLNSKTQYKLSILKQYVSMDNLNLPNVHRRNCTSFVLPVAGIETSKVRGMRDSSAICTNNATIKKI